MEFHLFDPVSARVLASTRYDEFAEALRNSGCRLCPALCADRHSIVVDRGQPSPIMIVGEAPGENEDLQGKAFVGRGGKLFDSMMAEIGIDTNRDTLIANVVKCRPPKNRPPTPLEASNCKPYLMWQIRAVAPKIVILLGATAARHVAPKSVDVPMKDRVGRFFELPEHPGILFLTLYHPAFLLRDPRRKPETMSHLQALRTRMEALGLHPGLVAGK